MVATSVPDSHGRRGPSSGFNGKPETSVSSTETPPPGRRPWRDPRYIAIAAIIVVILLVVTVILPSITHPGSSGPSGTVAYSDARVVSDRYVTAHYRGNWTLIEAGGLDVPADWNASLAPLTAEAIPGPLPVWAANGCTFTQNSSWNLNSSLPHFSGDVTQGVAPFWEFLYRNASDGVVIAVLNGEASLFGTVSGPASACGLDQLSALPTGVGDSPAAGEKSVGQAGPFLTRYSGIAAKYDLFSYGNPSAPVWAVTYLTCQGHAGITSVINDSSGEYWPGGLEYWPLGNCQPSPILINPPVLELGNNTLLTQGMEGISVSVVQASAGITWSNLSFTALNDTAQNASWGSWITSGWTILALASNNSTIAAYSPSNWEWSGNATQPLSVGDRIELQLSKSFHGVLILEVIGLGAFAGGTSWGAYF